MAEWYDRFKRINNFRGDSSGEAMTNHSQDIINKRFKDSPSYRLAKVKSTQYPDLDEIDVRAVSIDRMGSLRDVIFRPESGLERGTYLQFDNATWIIFDAYTNTVSPKATVQQCNELLKFKTKNGEVHKIYTYAGSSSLGSKASQLRAEIPYNKLDIKEPTSQMFVHVESNSLTIQLDVNDRLIIGKRPFKIIGKDDSTMTQIKGDGEEIKDFNFGILVFTLVPDTIKNGDDLENGIAANFGDGNENWGNSEKESESWGDW